MEEKKQEESEQQNQPAPAAEDNNELETLEDQDTTVTAKAGEQSADSAGKKEKKSPSKILTKIASRVNVYLLLFIVLIIVALIIMFVAMQAGRKEEKKQEEITAQELTEEAAKNLNSNETTVGDPKQLLNIESNAVFAGKVLIRDGLDVAGPIKVGGDLSLPGITVSGKSAFDEIQVNSLSIAGDTSVQGILTVQNNLSVNGQATFSGPISAPSITIDALQLNGDIQFNRHIDAGGGTPGVSGGNAVGSGGTVTISGTDTAGTVTINVGAGAGGGVLASVNFTRSFTNTPHVVMSPVGAPAPNSYVTNRTTSGFSITTSSGLPAGSISFDYVVID